MRGRTGHNIRLHVRLPPSYQGIDAWKTLQLNIALVPKLRGSLMGFAYILSCYPWCLYNQALANVRSIGAGIKCLYCSSHNAILPYLLCVTIAMAKSLYFSWMA